MVFPVIYGVSVASFSLSLLEGLLFLYLPPLALSTFYGIMADSRIMGLTKSWEEWSKGIISYPA